MSHLVRDQIFGVRIFCSWHSSFLPNTLFLPQASAAARDLLRQIVMADYNFPSAFAAAQPRSLRLALPGQDGFDFPQRCQPAKDLPCQVDARLPLLEASTACGSTPVEVILGNSDLVSTVAPAVPVPHGASCIRPAQHRKHSELPAMETVPSQAAAASGVSADHVVLGLDDFFSAIAAAQPRPPF